MRTPHQTRRPTLSLIVLLTMLAYAGFALGCLIVEETTTYEDDHGGTTNPRPSDPGHPTHPTVPTDPTNPTAPTDPTDPTNPVPDCPISGEVCGVDGVSYETRCAASRAHVRVDYIGACAPACQVDADCAIYELCSSQGRCEAVSCQEIDAPVCGVDGNTYPNACDANAHHVAVDYDGECAPACNVDADCEDATHLCNGAGRCEEASCPVLAPDDISQEVCAGDGFTYQTACQARLARQTIVHEGCCVE